MYNMIHCIINHNLILTNQLIQYFHDRRTQQAPSRNDYDRDKVVKNGNIHTGIPTPEIKKPMIPLVNVFNQ